MGHGEAPIVHAIQAELNLWYLDDATIRDSLEVVLADLDVVQKMAAEVGLTLNSSKREMEAVGTRSVDEEQSVIMLFKKTASGKQDAWLKRSLPVEISGFGIRHSVNMAIPFFLASLHSSLSYLEFLLPANIFLNTPTIITKARKFWETSCHAEEVPAGLVCCIQSIWEAPVIQHTLFDLTISTDTAEDKARLLVANA
ncbi:hypothetical protein ILUMI_05486 [Ignelater luminosus]|uniref:Reverse transcriptase domain-containing protein n=1 Tax=Ignelater luminosus TaxID=2038154 RepID=A0A8K0D7M0_IGNLU|nr:hypothetical protein ILUMI_05486 [Ignelater luminosus]